MVCLILNEFNFTPTLIRAIELKIISIYNKYCLFARDKKKKEFAYPSTAQNVCEYFYDKYLLNIPQILVNKDR